MIGQCLVAPCLWALIDRTNGSYGRLTMIVVGLLGYHEYRQVIGKGKGKGVGVRYRPIELGIG